MRKRMLVMLGIVIAFVAIIGGIKASQIKKAMAAGASFAPPPEAVSTTIAKAEKWDTSLNAIGSVVAVQGVTVAADLPGLVDQISFESGKRVNRGDVLVRLDTKQESAQLAAALAQRDLARVQFQRARGLRAQDIVAQEVVDQNAAEYKQAEARVGEIRATIERKTIRAPFTGVLGIREVNRGQYLAGGAPIVSLQALQPVYVQFTVPQQEVAKLRSTGVVTVTSDGFAGTETGRVTAVDSQVDEATRNVTVQATFENRDLRMHPGMYVQAQLARGMEATVLTLPASAISYAPFGDSIFIVEDMKDPKGNTYKGVRQQFVKLGGSRGDVVAVLTGLKAGEEVVTSGVFKLRPNAAVQVNNSVQPGTSQTPKPEDS
jgi:membrane fusion protein (multidrug efflux system)